MKIMVSFLFQKFDMEIQNIDTMSNTLVYEYLRTHKNSNIRKLAEKLKTHVPIQVQGENLSITAKRNNVYDQECVIEGGKEEQLIAEIAVKDKKIKYLIGSFFELLLFFIDKLSSVKCFFIFINETK